MRLLKKEETKMENQTQQTQVQNNQQTQQNQTQQNNFVFDPNNLPPEFARYVDQQRTQASQTARANAKKELLKDENFLNEVRGTVTPQVEKTTEQKFHDQLSALSLRTSKSEVRNILSQAGIKGDEALPYIDMFATEDIESSVEKATNFVSAFNNTIKSRMDKKQQEDLQNMTTPQVNPNTVTETENLQAQLDEARKDTSFMKNVRISAIMRTASEKGIILK